MSAFVVEQLIKHRETDIQARFARMAEPMFIHSLDVKAEISTRGLKLLGKNEHSLKSATQKLARFFPGKLIALAPDVIFLRDPAREPVMRLTIEAPCRAERDIRLWLARRETAVTDVKTEQDRLTLRALGPLSRLLGRQAELAAVCGEAVSMHMEFSHYAPLPEEDRIA